MGGRRRSAAATVWLWAAAAAACGGCTQILGADWDKYQDGAAAGGAGATGAGGCSNGEPQCPDDTPQPCDEQGEGGDACAGQTCVDGECAAACAPEERRCLDGHPQTCDERGQWQPEDDCPSSMPVCNGGTCAGLSCDGLDTTCGPDGDESCCAGAPVPAGSFDRENDSAYPATVSAFVLDRFEVTVGRFRKFVEAYPGSRPAAGAGQHPKLEESGWPAGWNDILPDNAEELKESLKCAPDRQTWTDEAGSNELLPINCVSWYEAFAFCAWDGGRLPTETEWNYAAAGGDEQRIYPWSSEEPDASHAVYGCTGHGDRMCTFDDIQPVGSRSTKGDGRWKHADLSGSMWEWVLDRYADHTNPCRDCANMDETTAPVVRGGGWGAEATDLRSYTRYEADPLVHEQGIGFRCARTP
ncbi:formylglycine-generating enzyme family protein [Sorangium cellulosum]|nr:SUMF1/EgtB/PvdO family nonheme iron enzyme [Sorangium cellulosum]